MKNFILKTILFFLSTSYLIILLSDSALADEGSKYSEVARERQYIGGKDESDLKVQPASAVPSKVKPAAEPVENNEGF